MSGIYIIIPTYNEAANIKRITAEIQGLNSSYNIIIVDDNSPDGTAEIVKALQQTQSGIYLNRRPAKLGIGSAIRDGMKEALAHKDCLFIMTMDADFSHNPLDIQRLLKESLNADMVQGSRYIRGGRITGWTWQRKLISRSANFLYRFLLKFPQHEVTTYFRVYSRKCAEIVVQHTREDKYEFCLESALAVHDHGLSVKEVPITFVNRTAGTSKLKISDIAHSLLYLAYIFILRLSRNLGVRRFIRFCIVGATGVLVNQGLLWLLTDVSGLYYMYSALLSIEASIISNFIFNDRWTFRDKRSAAGPIFIRFLKYNLLCAAGSLLNYGILWFFTDILHFYYLISNLFGIAAAVIWNYIISLNWAWMKKNSVGK